MTPFLRPRCLVFGDIQCLKTYQTTKQTSSSERPKEKRFANLHWTAWSIKNEDLAEKSLEEKFLAFRQFSARCISSGDGVSVESHTYELLALKYIVLLKPFQYSESMRIYLDDKTLNELYTKLSQPLYGSKQSFDPTLASLVSDAVYCYTQSTENIGANSGALMECARKLILMSADRPRCEASILFGLGNLLHKLPIRTMMEGGNRGNRVVEFDIRSNPFTNTVKYKKNKSSAGTIAILSTDSNSSSIAKKSEYEKLKGEDEGNNTKQDKQYEEVSKDKLDDEEISVKGSGTSPPLSMELFILHLDYAEEQEVKTENEGVLVEK
ncbi:hypothetical protein BDC45DRAFT_559655 [Circinella umbellata]|nr:hypothetical protein BDC45DRAFT_559655 [Circinella umbellata]